MQFYFIIEWKLKIFVIGNRLGTEFVAALIVWKNICRASFWNEKSLRIYMDKFQKQFKYYVYLFLPENNFE